MKKIMMTAAALALWAGAARAEIKVVAASSDLRYICERVGGAEVKVESLASGDQDLHMVEPRPSMVYKLKKADLVVRVGLDLDMWVDSLINAARNPRLFYGRPGYVDASAGVPLLEKPEGKVDAAMGDIHIYGNPHYWLDPANAKIMAKNVAAGFTRAAPDKAAVFEANYAAFAKEADERLAGWAARMAKYKGLKVITYHSSWPYFAARFGLGVAGHVEPKPGIPPSASHLEGLVKKMKAENIKVILTESYYPRKGPDFLAGKTGAAVVTAAVSAGGTADIKTYFDVFDRVIAALEKAAAKE
ncbi:MAG TPA: metal ABC transporter substrate-binding protein [Elusimicrobiales bacterium]|nr:metal ABC transporter substrate-binding protein [Elusimicrobiales bacterium]